MEQRHDYRDNRELYPTLANDEELVFSGLALATVAIIMVSNNHINQVELIQIMRNTFGVDPNKELDVLGITIEEFYKRLDKTDYVNRSVIRVENEEIVEYSVGRRAKAEFNRESFVAFAQIIYNEPDGSPEFLAQINATIDATFGPTAAQVSWNVLYVSRWLLMTELLIRLFEPNDPPILYYCRTSQNEYS